MTKKIISFPPVLPENPKVLILGSMPGIKSLGKHEYYGNSRNHFWPIMFELFEVPSMDSYPEKINFIKKQGIALWDSIGACYREGSLDSSIKGEEPNDIEGLLRKHPSIRLIVCNGTKSYKTFMNYFPAEKIGSIEVLKMPSTSPIPGRYTKTFAGKVEEWRSIMSYLSG